MKTMNQKQIPRRKSSFLAAALFLAISSHGAQGALTLWQITPIVQGDKTYYFQNASDNMKSIASVNATEAAGVHSFNLTNLAGANPGDFVEYAMQINDPTNYFYVNRTSENDVLNNVTGGSTTIVASDAAFTTVLNTTPLVGTGVGTTWATGSGLQLIYVRTTITNVDGGVNKISNVTFDVTQTSAIPEVSSTFSLLGLISSGLLLRRRTKNLR